MTTIYHNNRCTKSRETLKILEENTKDFEIIEYLKNPPTVAELSDIIQKLKIKPEQLLRKSEELFKEKFKGKNYSDQEWITIMVENPVLIERPIVINGNRAVIGRPPENVLSIL
jgi:arsenate reductase (glutaredoxin)